ncbi:hypothetical protein KIH86_07065 [Paenibacillus sp. HN-1]|uniref:hypothetical protein n=1 Tax=Paenibacillus TaxID=44249 RepID=UPI001CA81BF8|nr:MULTISPECIES: hypothetical protein [Paenibacillus]MBY9080418.1 hypothetical protein [Paenibacillus sp. CGMCC 1.18879]MBY9083998.1 hypothetical protein [Paenibacillus sinensis]
MNEQDLTKNEYPGTETPSGASPAFSPYPSPYPGDRSLLKHSGPGIASFVIAMVALAGYIIAFAVAGSMMGPLIDETDGLSSGSGGAFLLLGFSMLGLGALNVIGVIVGIIGLVLRQRRKVFGIIGTIINSLVIVAFVLLIALALAAAGSLS